jgi:uridine phosphorylase
MGFPNFEQKHVEPSFFSAADFIKWRKCAQKLGQKPLRKYILVYYPHILHYFRRKYAPKKILINRLITIYKYKSVGVVQMTGIGSPHAVTVFEELIALGGKKFLNIGSAGGLKDFGIFLCARSIRDEGTSHHYLPGAKYAYPNKQLTKQFGIFLNKHNLNFECGDSWTIDAAYRETKTEIQHYLKEGVKTVEMESSALFTVAKIRKVKIASAFVVSDVLGEEKWDPQFGKKHVKVNLHALLDAAVDCLGKN